MYSGKQPTSYLSTLRAYAPQTISDYHDTLESADLRQAVAGVVLVARVKLRLWLKGSAETAGRAGISRVHNYEERWWKMVEKLQASIVFICLYTNGISSMTWIQNNKVSSPA